MNTRSFRSHPGFTLVELMLATSISTILICAIMSVFVLFARSSRRIESDSATARATSLGLEQFARDLGVDYELLYDTDGEFLVATGLNAFPVTLFVNADGMVVRQTGALTQDELEQYVQELLP